MKRIRTALSEIWDGVKLFAILVAAIAWLYALLIYAPVYCRYLTADIAAALIGAIVTAVCAGIVLGVIAAAVISIRRKCRSGIRYHKKRIPDRAERCLGYVGTETICRAARRSK